MTTPHDVPCGTHGAVVWLTGLSGAGKSTVAELLAAELRHRAHPVEVLDGDEVRRFLTAGLGFSREDRDTNVRRIGYVASLLAKHGVTVITAAISPYAATRAEVRAMAPAFVEVFVDAPLEVCAARDVKGLYEKAFAGELDGFTGVSDPYEPPRAPDVHLRTDRSEAADCVDRLVEELARRGLLQAAAR
ncbi:adenylyl-sulfate kinase [Egibacter rhizosphaerae]|uniref:Adenylyl-sulfate kinase n=1 Tax=Egibacter rhizosphaerae TaxID=1670831 RepID=A0A411YH96_9ACTN|nr:adenylyl-sulfate kinase [Egibacter rhizosphaerae]QBI20638.1 adenylyl-sulfate kinase [Egibacter rhizosphaerae]